MLALHKSSVDN